MLQANDSPTQPVGVAVTLQNVRRVFEPDVVTIDDLSLDVAAGDFVSIIGPSGSGKSTLLRLIAGLDHPQDGTVDVGMDRRDCRAGIAYVFQDAHLLPWRDVRRNVELPLE